MDQPGLFRKNAANGFPELSEVDVQNYALSRLSLICNIWRNNSGMIHGKRYNGSDMHIKLAPKGSSDLIGYHRRNGKFVAVECKKRLGKTDVLQDYFLDEVKSSGGYGFSVHTTEEVDTVAEFLEHEGI